LRSILGAAGTPIYSPTPFVFVRLRSKAVDEAMRFRARVIPTKAARSRPDGEDFAKFAILAPAASVNAAVFHCAAMACLSTNARGRLDAEIALGDKLGVRPFFHPPSLPDGPPFVFRERSAAQQSYTRPPKPDPCGS